MTDEVDESDMAAVNFTCIARGSPEPQIVWRRGDVDVTASSTSSSGTAPDFITVTSTLTIDPAERSDAGNYTCVASNDVFGEERSDTQVFTLVVNCEFTRLK